MRGNKRKAAIVLFASGFSVRQVARLLSVSVADVTAALRKAVHR